jgi:hypothetical protein
MEFYIKKNATLPVLKMQVVKDGRSDYNKMMEMIEESSIFFSMVDTETGIPRIVTRPAGFVEKTQMDPNAEYEYYVYYQFAPNDTRKVGRYEGQFLLRNSDGTLILPIREKLYINVQESFIADDLPYESCYVVGFPCCVSIPTTTTTTTTPCPSCRSCCPPTPTPEPITTTTTQNLTTTTTQNLTTTTTQNLTTTTTQNLTPNCFNGINDIVIETIYLHECSEISLLPSEWQNIGLGGPTIPNNPFGCTSGFYGLGVGNHGCNRALFEFKSGSISIGESNINNAYGSTSSGILSPYGTYLCGDYNNTPAPLTGGIWGGISGANGARYSRIDISPSQIALLLAASGGGSIVIDAYCSEQLYGCPGSTYDPSCNCSSVPGCHSDVTFVRITQGNTLLYAGGIGTSISVTINPCPTPTPTPTPTCVGITNNTIYIKYNTIP